MSHKLYFLLLSLFLLAGCEKTGVQNAQSLKVPVFEVKSAEIPVQREFVGQTYGKNDIDIRARVDGFLEKIHFAEGSEVRKGQLLYEIDPQPFEAKVAQQQSALAQANTLLAKNQSDLNRIRPLADKNAVSKSDLDAAVAAYEAAQAEVSAAEAGLRLSNIELGYTKVYAPVHGIIGISNAREGDYVGQLSSSVLNTISEIDTVRVRFSITESDYLTVRSMRDTLSVEEKEELAGLELILANGSIHPYKGKLDFANRQIDRSTGTLLLQSSFPNPRGILRPGQSAIVRATVFTIADGIMIPQRAVTEMQGIHQVSIMTSENQIVNREVEVGPKKGNMWIIRKGLSPGDMVVLENVYTRGVKVTFVPEVQEVELIN